MLTLLVYGLQRNDGDEGQSPDLENQGDTQGASALDPQQTTIDQVGFCFENLLLEPAHECHHVLIVGCK